MNGARHRMGLIVIALLALGIVLARHWPRPVVLVSPKNPCGFVPNS